MCTGGSFPGGKAQTDRSPPSNAEVKNSGAVPLFPRYVCLVWCLIKHRDSLMFYLVYTGIRLETPNSLTFINVLIIGREIGVTTVGQCVDGCIQMQDLL
jgi:hypothetical protein